MHDVHEEDNVPPAQLVDILYESVRPPVLEFPPANLQRCHWAQGMRAESKQQETDVHNNYVDVLRNQSLHQLARLIF